MEGGTYDNDMSMKARDINMWHVAFLTILANFVHLLGFGLGFELCFYSPP